MSKAGAARNPHVETTKGNPSSSGQHQIVKLYYCSFSVCFNITKYDILKGYTNNAAHVDVPSGFELKATVISLV